MSKELLENWLEYGLIKMSPQAERGYVWTRKAKKLVPTPVRTILASMANVMRHRCRYEIKRVAQYGFDKKGFYHEKT